MTSDPNSDQQAVRALLDALESGARDEANSVSAWADWVSRADTGTWGAQFIDQLGREWLPAAAPDALGASVAAEVREHLLDWGCPGVHMWGHTLRVTGAALHLAREAEVDSVLAYLTAISHDIAKLDEGATGVDHEQAGARFVAEVLRDDLAPEQIALIQSAIRREAGSDLGDLLHDADKLDKIGAAGVVRRIALALHAGGIRAGLAQVQADFDDFPAMRFDFSRALAQQKQAFLADFLPLAWAALDAEG